MQRYHSHLYIFSGCWGSNAANTINGTEGSMFEPLLIYNKTKKLTIYNEQLFRYGLSFEISLNGTKWHPVLLFSI